MSVRLALVLALVAAAPAAAADDRCHGREVTIDGEKSASRTLVGTPGPDVIVGSRFRDRILGGGGADVICGGDGGDLIDGGDGFDRLYGDDGDDLFGGAGVVHDIVLGGPGDDEVSLAGSTAGARVDLTRETMLADGARRYGRLRSIHDVVGTRFADVLVGDRDDNILVGLAGADVLDGRAGDNRLKGGDDIDQATYAASSVPVEVDLAGREAFRGKGRQRVVDELYGIEVVEGTDFADTIEGGPSADFLLGGDGDDVIKGYDGNDGIDGGAGSDTIHPGSGDDVVDGGPNDPVTGPTSAGDMVSAIDGTIEGGTPGGRPYVVYEAFLTYGMFGEPPGSTGEGDDRFSGIESLRGMKGAPSNLEGDGGPNVLIGGTRSDLLQGGAGNDFLFGLGGEDTISAGDGDDYLDGGGKDSPHDADKLDGEAGTDSCNGAQPTFVSGCELGVTGA